MAGQLKKCVLGPVTASVSGSSPPPDLQCLGPALSPGLCARALHPQTPAHAPNCFKLKLSLCRSCTHELIGEIVYVGDSVMDRGGSQRGVAPP